MLALGLAVHGQVISAFAPEMMRPDREESVELRFQVKPELLKQIEELKGRLAHSHPGISLGELMSILCSLGLEATEPAKSPAAPPMAFGLAVAI